MRDRIDRPRIERLPATLVVALAAALLAILALAGCGGAPLDRLAAAEREIAVARAAGAGHHAASLLAQAETLRQQAVREIEHQRARRLAVRSFRRAELLLGDVETLARQARDEAERAAAAAAVEARTDLAQAAAAVEQVADALERVPAGADTVDDAARMRADLAALRRSLAAAGADLEAGDVAAAGAAARAVEVRARSTARVIEAALERIMPLPAATAAGP